MKRYSLSACFLATLISFVTPLWADPATLPIINGQRISNLNTPVVMIEMQTASGTYICSGSLIAPTAILTARHCVIRDPRRMEVFIANRTFNVKRVKIHPHAHMDGNGLLHQDVAVLFLRKPSSKPRLSLLLSHPVSARDPLTIYGYGLDQHGQLGALRVGFTTVDSVHGEYVLTRFMYSSQGNTCNGDSGGPAVVSYSDPRTGKQRSGIVGIVSSGTTEHCTAGDITYFINTQASSIRNFIEQQVPAVRLN